MAGLMSSLGVGSGVLTYDTLDKMKNFEIDAQIAPMTKKLNELQKKEEAMSNLITLTATLKTAVMDLADDATFQKRAVSVNGKDISVTVNDGVAVQDMDIVVNQLAKRDINESKGFASEDSIVSSSDTSFTLNIDGKDYTINVKAGTKLSELRDLINDSTDGKIKASILNVGGDDPYKLILKSTETGANQAISVTYEDSDFLDLNNIQSAQDASFKFNGVDITRSSNTIKDLVAGVTLELKGDSGEKNFASIKQDRGAIADMIEEFVNSYNTWQSKISELTRFDPDGKNSGVFVGDTTIKNLVTDVKRGFFNITGDRQVNYVVENKDSSGNTTGLTVMDKNFRSMLGIDVNKSGVMTFDRSKFLEEFDANPQKMQEDILARFQSLNDALKRATDSNTGYLKNYEEQLKREDKNLSEQKERSLELIDRRYETLAMQWASYDSMINSFNQSYGALQMAIDAQLAKK